MALFPADLALRVTVLPTDKLLIHNITTGVTEYTTVARLMASLSTFAAGQIGFPAVQIPSANVNTLDDYEEGTWIPGISFGGAAVGITYTTQAGYYTKIGNIVTITSNIVLSSKGTSVGAALITGLPFPVVNNIAGYSIVALRLNVITFANQFMGYTNAGTTTIVLEELTEIGGRTALTNIDFANNSTVGLSVTYRVA